MVSPLLGRFLVSFNLKSAICGLQSAVCSLQSAVCSLRSAVCKCHTPLFNEVLGITNDFLYPSNSKTHEKEPLYEDTSLLWQIKIGQTLHYQGSTVVLYFMGYQKCQPLNICKFPTTCSLVQLTPNHQSLDTPTDANQLQHSTVKDCTSQLLIFHHVIFISMLPNFMKKSDDLSWGKRGFLGNSWWGCAVRFSKS